EAVGKILHQTSELGLRRLRRDAGLESANPRVLMRVDRSRVGIELFGNPEVDAEPGEIGRRRERPWFGKREAGLGDANDLAAAVAHRKHAADDVRVAAERALPVLVAQYHVPRAVR